MSENGDDREERNEERDEWNFSKDVEDTFDLADPTDNEGLETDKDKDDDFEFVPEEEQAGDEDIQKIFAFNQDRKIDVSKDTESEPKQPWQIEERVGRDKKEENSVGATVEEFLEGEGDLDSFDAAYIQETGPRDLYTLIEQIGDKLPIIEIYGKPQKENLPEEIEDRMQADPGDKPVFHTITCGKDRDWSSSYGAHASATDLTGMSMVISDLVRDMTRNSVADIIEAGLEGVRGQNEAYRKVLSEAVTSDSFEDYAGQNASLDELTDFIRNRGDGIQKWEEETFHKLIDEGMVREPVRIVYTASDLFGSSEGTSAQKNYLESTEGMYGPNCQTIIMDSGDYTDKIENWAINARLESDNY